MSVAAFWAGAAHPRRQKHREMPPPGASAPAFAATVEPAFTQITSDLPPAYLQSDSSNERVLGMTCAVFPVYTLFRASILDFKARLENRCKLFPVFTLFRASILDFKPKLANRCMLFPVYTLFRAVILDFEPRLGNRCTDSGDFRGFCASILEFRPRFANRCIDSGDFCTFLI